MHCPSGEAVPAKRKPRKLATPWKDSVKEVANAQYAWYTILHGYKLEAPNIVATIVCDNDGEWVMVLTIGDKRFSGKRKKLEEAFKTVDRMISKEAHNVWAQINCHVVLRAFGYTLDNIDED